MFAPVFLDYNATTPLNAEVLQAMLPYLTQRFGNASSRHEYGRSARKAIDEARQQVAEAVNAHPTEVVFTSGGSEANNLFIKGAADKLKPGLIAVSAIEHPCVTEAAKALRAKGWQYREIAVDGNGVLDVADFAAVLLQRPSLLSIMLANNETGALQYVESLAQEAKTVVPSAWFHSDAVQAFGKVEVDFRRLNAAGVHALTLSGHKIGGPQGVGALVLDKRVELSPLISGGGHERGLRSGTENVAAIVGFGKACELLKANWQQQAQRLQVLRQQLETGLNGLGATVFSSAVARLPNTSYFALPDIDGETLVARLDRAGFAVASGAACSSAKTEPSHVLMAMGISPELAQGAVRVSLGGEVSDADVARFLATLIDTVIQLKSLSVIAAGR